MVSHPSAAESNALPASSTDASMGSAAARLTRQITAIVALNIGIPFHGRMSDSVDIRAAEFADSLGRSRITGVLRGSIRFEALPRNNDGCRLQPKPEPVSESMFAT
jgi:hypothetical protein